MPAKSWQLERASNEAEGQEGTSQVQGDVHGVVTADVEAAGRVIERERKTDEWPARYRRLAFRQEPIAQARQPTDLLVLDDGRLVVDDEGPSQAVRVGHGNGERDDRRAPADGAGVGNSTAGHGGFTYRAKTTVAGVGVGIISIAGNPASLSHER